MLRDINVPAFAFLGAVLVGLSIGLVIWDRQSPGDDAPRDDRFELKVRRTPGDAARRSRCGCSLQQGDDVRFDVIGADPAQVRIVVYAHDEPVFETRGDADRAFVVPYPGKFDALGIDATGHPGCESAGNSLDGDMAASIRCGARFVLAHLDAW